jgi:hypothetical protein
MSSCSASSEEDDSGRQEEEHEGRERGAAKLRRCIDAVCVAVGGRKSPVRHMVAELGWLLTDLSSWERN